jgi:hypothetical protein
MSNNDLEFSVEATTTGRYADVFVGIAMTGVYTPTNLAKELGVSSPIMDSEPVGIPSFMDELAEKGYLAIRVPHVPPTHTVSTILSPTLDFSYYSPPATTTLTTVPIPLTRRDEYSATVNAKFPTGVESHWEAWWLPPGVTFPIPSAAFRLDEWKSLDATFRIDFGQGSHAVACAGCPLDYAIYNGYTFIGPFETQMRLHNAPTGNPLVGFEPRCGRNTIMQYISPTVPFSHVHWLANYDTMTRTFTIDTVSSQDWAYSYYTGPDKDHLVPVPSPTFTVKVAPDPGHWPNAGCLGIVAVHTPAITYNDKVRETFSLTATSTISPEVRASSHSFALAPGYELNEEGAAEFVVYLPLVVK